MKPEFPIGMQRIMRRGSLYWVEVYQAVAENMFGRKYYGWYKHPYVASEELAEAYRLSLGADVEVVRTYTSKISQP